MLALHVLQNTYISFRFILGGGMKNSDEATIHWLVRVNVEQSGLK